MIRQYNGAQHSRIRIAELAGLKTGLPWAAVMGGGERVTEIYRRTAGGGGSKLRWVKRERRAVLGTADLKFDDQNEPWSAPTAYVSNRSLERSGMFHEE
jgi:hypothetical protein